MEVTGNGMERDMRIATSRPFVSQAGILEPWAGRFGRDLEVSILAVMSKKAAESDTAELERCRVVWRWAGFESACEFEVRRRKERRAAHEAAQALYRRAGGGRPHGRASPSLLARRLVYLRGARARAGRRRSH